MICSKFGKLSKSFNDRTYITFLYEKKNGEKTYRKGVVIGLGGGKNDWNKHIHVVTEDGFRQFIFENMTKVKLCNK